MTTNPCKDCGFRHPCCWSECVPYKQWKEEMQAVNKWKNKDQDASNFLIDAIRKEKRRINRK